MVIISQCWRTGENADKCWTNVCLHFLKGSFQEFVEAVDDSRVLEKTEDLNNSMD